MLLFSVPAGGRSCGLRGSRAPRRRHRYIHASPCAHAGLTESLHRLVTVPSQNCSSFPWPLSGEGCRCSKCQAIKGQVYLVRSQPLPVIRQKMQLSAFRATSQRGRSLCLFCQPMANASHQGIPAHLCRVLGTELRRQRELQRGENCKVLYRTFWKMQPPCPRVPESSEPSIAAE